VEAAVSEIEQLHTGAKATTTDGKTSHVVALIVDSDTSRVTHLVVQNADIYGTGRLVPLEHVKSFDADLVVLDLSIRELVDLDRFLVPGHVPDGEPKGGLIAYWLGPPGGYTWALRESPPRPSDVVFRTDAAVELNDGHKIGTADELMIDPSSGAISGLRLPRGHLLGHRDVIIPSEAIESFGDHGVRLTLDRHSLERLQSNDEPRAK
jgi:uncharacterized protein YrrD